MDRRSFFHRLLGLGAGTALTKAPEAKADVQEVKVVRVDVAKPSREELVGFFRTKPGREVLHRIQQQGAVMSLWSDT